MSKRVEEAALKAYPEKWFRDIDGDRYDCNRCERCAFQEGYEQAEKELVSLINQLCEAILFEWKDAAELARETITQIKAREEQL